MLPHCLPVCIVSDKKSAVSLSLFLCMHYLLSFMIFSFSLSLVLSNLIKMCLALTLFTFLVPGISWSFMTLWAYSSYKIEKDLPIMSENTCNPLLCLLQILAQWLFFAFIFFPAISWFILDSFYCYDFKLTNLFSLFSSL